MEASAQRISDLRCEILTSRDLEARPALGTALIALVNDTFRQAKAVDPGLWETDQIRPRFSDLSSLTNMLGTAGICAVILDSVNGIEIPVATASIIPRIAELIGSYWDDGNSPIEFELRAVVTHSSSVYRKQGLASRCCKMLEDIISSYLQSWSSSTAASEATVSLHGSWRLWLHTVHEESAEYWRRRGFQETERHPLPIGTWGYKRERTLMTMMRDVPVFQGCSGAPKLTDYHFPEFQAALKPFLTNQALTEQAASISQRRDQGLKPSGRRMGPKSAQNEDDSSVLNFDELRNSCRELLEPSSS